MLGAQLALPEQIKMERSVTFDARVRVLALDAEIGASFACLADQDKSRLTSRADEVCFALGAAFHTWFTSICPAQLFEIFTWWAWVVIIILVTGAV